MARHTISNGDDIIDSRDVIARIGELADEHTALTEAVEVAHLAAAEEGLDDDTRKTREEELEFAQDALDDWTQGDAQEELSALRSLQDDAEGYCPDWHHGATLIRDSYFEDYARETAEDIYGRELRDARWPFDCIDWEKAAEALQMDYTSVEYDGVTYWVR